MFRGRHELPVRRPAVPHVVRLLDPSQVGGGPRDGLPHRDRPEHLPVGSQGLVRLGDSERHGAAPGDAERGERPQLHRAHVRHLHETQAGVFQLHPHAALCVLSLPHSGRVLASARQTG